MGQTLMIAQIAIQQTHLEQMIYQIQMHVLVNLIITTMGIIMFASPVIILGFFKLTL